MRTIELVDEQLIMIGDIDENEKINYVFLDRAYTELEALVIMSYNQNYSLNIRGAKLNVPNLTGLQINGSYALSVVQELREDFLHTSKITSIEFINSNLERLPGFVRKMMTLEYLNFRNESLQEIPHEIFEMTELRTLNFEYATKIEVVPDDIKRLQKLKAFNLWRAPIEYLSPELFLLPEIGYINFAYSSFEPTKELIEKAKEYQSTGKTLLGFDY